MITIEQVKDRLCAWQPTAKILEIAPLTPDASKRRYFRFTLATELAEVESRTVVAMVFDSLAQPECGGTTVDPNVSCVRLGKLLGSYGYPVAKILFGAENELIFFIEDLGDQMLIDLLIDRQGRACVKNRREIVQLYTKAIDAIGCLQRIPQQENCFAFGRKFAAEAYAGELNEVLEFYLRPQVQDTGLEKELTGLFEIVVKELLSFPLVLAHRDYHSWNLMIDRHHQLRVIDYQDALMAPRTYDLVPLLNDRDTNLYLGEKLYYELYHYAFQLAGKSAQFVNEYAHVLLQRDLKIVGRFNKLATERGLVHYRQWVPGALYTIGSLLAFMSEDFGRHEYGELLRILQRFSPEVEKGAKHKLNLS